MNIIIFLIILLILVVSHEWGHFIIAKKNGIRVDEFAFGMGPKIFSFKKGETVYRINVFPIGGYVKIFGENPDNDSINGPDSKRSFINKPIYVQAMVLFGGVLMNFIVAWIFLSIGFMSGLPSSVNGAPQGSRIENVNLAVVGVNKNTPAEKAGLEIGDRILHLKSGSKESDVPSAESLQFFLREHSKETTNFTIQRNKEIKNIDIVPNIKDGKPEIGIAIDMVGNIKLNPLRALWEGLDLSWIMTRNTAVGFYNLIHDSVLGKADMSSLSGPIGIVGIVGNAANFGFVYLLSFTAIISVNLAVINLIPFPALDGGRLLFLLIEKIKGSRISPKVANTVNMVGFGLLMLLMIIITYHDIVKLF